MDTEEKLRAYLKKSVAELLAAREHIAELESRAAQPVAVVGIGCRFPGGVDTPEKLWALLSEGRDAVGPYPQDRGWELYDEPDGEVEYARVGGFLDEAADFDPAFFGISPKEALAMDPQQRTMLEITWEALERAGIAPGSLRDTPASVFTGVTLVDYDRVLHRTRTDTDGYFLTGNANSVVSGRVAYSLGLSGSAVTLDSACSSSLVSLHYAMKSLAAGETSLALAGGVTLMSTPLSSVEFSKMGGLSVRGACQSFSASADGIVWSEGAGVLVLERLSDAHANGHPVLGIIRASAVNQDGASNTLSTPNGPAQVGVIRAALDAARLSAADIDALEAHGTGTRLGDPIEANALLATYGRDRLPEQPLWLGSLKSNIGHTQAAAGVAGVIKMLLAMQHGVLPETLHADQPTSHVDWSSGGVRLLAEKRAWPETNRPRRAAVSAFGISGTNAHVILEQAPAPSADPASTDDATATAPPLPRVAAPGVVPPVLLSGHSRPALLAQARKLADSLDANGHHRTDLGLRRLARASHSARSALRYRLALFAEDAAQFDAALKAFAHDGQPSPVVEGRTVPDADRVVFVFPGQGGQWPDMARGLLETSPVFAEWIMRCSEALRPHTDWNLHDVLTGQAESELWDRVDVVQPALFAVMVSLAQVWRALGVEPAAVIGHSQGEIAAAVVAGALTLDDGARLVALRSQALTSLSGSGGMTSVAASQEVVRDLMAPHGEALAVAVVNGPAAVVVSGTLDALDALEAQCAAADIRTRRLAVDYASHSAQIDALHEQLMTELAGVEPKDTHIVFYSTVDAEAIPTSRLDTAYWFCNLRQTVEFDGTLRKALAEGFRTFVECSPHPVLLPPIGEIADTSPDGDVVAAGTLRRDQGGMDHVLRSAAELFVRGVPVDWMALFPEGSHPDDGTALPTYAFQRSRYWPDDHTGVSGDAASMGLVGLGHAILKAAIPSLAGDATILTGRVALSTHPWLADHQVFGSVVFPGAGFVDLATRAGDEVGCDTLAELTLTTPLVLSDDTPVHLRLVITEVDQVTGEHALEIFSRPEGGTDGWTPHAEAVLVRGAASEPAGPAAWPPPGAEQLTVDGFYGAQRERGYGYGPAFQGLRAAWRSGDDIYAEVELPVEEHSRAGGFRIHPALLDAALHGSALAVAAADGIGTMLPFAWSQVRLHALDARALRVRISRLDDRTITLEAGDTGGRPVLSVGALAMRPVSGNQLRGGGDADRLLRVTWAEVPMPTEVAHTASAPADRIEVPYSDTIADPTQAVEDVLGQAKAWLAVNAGSGRTLSVVTRLAVTASPGDAAVLDPAGAAVWGLIRTAQAEHPNSIVLVDLEPGADADVLLPVAIDLGESEIAFRNGRAYGRRLDRVGGGTPLPESGAAPWNLRPSGTGTLDGLRAVAAPEAARPLADGEVRVEVRAAGVNFRDSLILLGLYPGAATTGTEAAGVVVEAGPGVDRVAVGDRVTGLFPAAWGPLAVTDQRGVVRIPSDITYTQAAALPMAFLTAAYALNDLAQLRSGHRVLVHAAAGGTGMAAVQLARRAGAEVFATASPSKWPVLRARGFDDAHLASSRDAGFEQHFLAATSGAGVDIVLNSLTGELADASLRLLPSGGTFLELGKTDVRDPQNIAAAWPGVDYRAFETIDAGLDRIAETLDELAGLFDEGALSPLPVTVWGPTEATEAIRTLAAGRNVGKLVLLMPRTRPDHGTVLITGGTGLVGGAVARHLAAQHAVPRLLLLSRRGSAASGATELKRELERMGTLVDIVACDVADRAELAAVIEGIGTQYPLTGVVHSAATLDDGLLEDAGRAQLDAVLSAKALAAWHLHELTEHLDLPLFTLFSSFAGMVGAPGQAVYSSANAYVDALAQRRRAQGLAATSIAWGRWESESELTSRLSRADLARMGRSGMSGMSIEQGLALYDRAHEPDAPAVVAAARLDLASVAVSDTPALLERLLARRAPVMVSRERAGDPASGADSASWREQVLGMPAEARLAALSKMVRTHIAVVLGHAGPDDVDSRQAFRDLGLDSLTAVELRNRLSRAMGLRVSPTAIFDYPSAAELARHLGSRLEEEGAGSVPSPRAAPRSEAVTATVDSIFRNAVASDRFVPLLRLWRELAAFSPSFSGTGDGMNVRTPVRLSSGSEGARIYCVPSIFGKSGHEAFWRLGDAFRNRHDVSVLPLPGYGEDELLPESSDAVADLLTRMIADDGADDSPCVVLGYSSGAPIANAVARRLLEQNRAPAGLVLLDPFPLNTGSEVRVPSFLGQLLDRNEKLGDVGSNWPLAMARYMELAWPGAPREDVPVLLVRAVHSIEPPGDDALFETQAGPGQADEVVLPATHFSLLEEHVAATVAAISDWLSGTLAPAAEPVISAVPA